MKTPAARVERDDHPPSTDGTSAGRARLRPLAATFVVASLIAVAAQVVAADPASTPVDTTELAAQAVIAAPARPAIPVQAKADGDAAFAKVGDVALVSAAVTAQAAGAVDPTPPPPPTTTTTSTTTTTTAAPAPAPAPGGRCGGDLPPCWVMQRESGGNITAKNPSSSASGKWQFINSTWAGFGGYAEAWMAPESVQDQKARILWAGGAGCGHWSAC